MISCLKFHARSVYQKFSKMAAGSSQIFSRGSQVISSSSSNPIILPRLHNFLSVLSNLLFDQPDDRGYQIEQFVVLPLRRHACSSSWQDIAPFFVRVVRVGRLLVLSQQKLMKILLPSPSSGPAPMSVNYVLCRRGRKSWRSPLHKYFKTTHWWERCVSFAPACGTLHLFRPLFMYAAQRFMERRDIFEFLRTRFI